MFFVLSLSTLDVVPRSSVLDLVPIVAQFLYQYNIADEALRDFAPSIIKTTVRPRSESTGGAEKERYRCMSCQYPKCNGLPGEPCSNPDRVLLYPPTPSLYHKGKYLCVSCRFPPCSGCGAFRPRRTQTLQGGDREYHSEYNVFKKPTWQCCRCDKQAQNVRCSSCGDTDNRPIRSEVGG